MTAHKSFYKSLILHLFTIKLMIIISKNIKRITLIVINNNFGCRKFILFFLLFIVIIYIHT